jgi:hypothetical protein
LKESKKLINKFKLISFLNNNSDLMARQGRATELIVEELEKYTLSNDNCTVLSPDRIIDVITKTKREVDVSIRFDMGTHEFLTIIECRDRKYIQDVTWIEQIQTKTQNLNANKVIAVSTSDFTAPAKKKAKHYGIVLRTLTDFEAADAISWPGPVRTSETNFNIKHIKAEIVEVLSRRNNKKYTITAPIAEMFGDINKPIFKIESSGGYVTVSDVINNTNRANDNFLFKDLKDNDQPVIKKVNLIFDQDNKLCIMWKNEEFYIKKFELELECWVKMEELSLKDALRYSEDSKSLVDKFIFESQPEADKKTVFTIYQNYKTGKGLINAYFEKFDKRKK